jgi:hypothetical protein
MIYGNLISYSSTKKGKVWLFNRNTNWLASRAYNSYDMPKFYIEGNYSNIYSSLSTTGNEYQPLVMSPGDLIYAEWTVTASYNSLFPGVNGEINRTTIIGAGGWPSIGGGWAYTTAFRTWWRYNGTTFFYWSTRYSNGWSSHGNIETRTSNIDKWYFIDMSFNAGTGGGYNRPTWSPGTFPKTLYASSTYGYGPAATTPPNDQSSITLRKFVWQPSDAVVPSSVAQYTDTGWLSNNISTKPILYLQPIIGPTSSQYGNPSISLEEYESLYWNNDIITGP